ncbi:MAG: arginine deiminase family protein [PVC group bacterium]
MKRLVYASIGLASFIFNPDSISYASTADKQPEGNKVKTVVTNSTKTEDPGKRVSVNHEWGSLKEVIVGRGDDFVIPSWSDQVAKLEAPPETKEYIKKHGGKKYSEVDPEGSKEIVEQMNGLAGLLESRGIIVHRNRLYTPEEMQYLSDIQKGASLIFMRDPVIVIGNNIIETALQAPVRRKERFSIREILLDAAKDGNARYISMPVASPRFPKEAEYDPFLEGGDVLLNGYEIYAGYSGRASNQAGIEWLQQYLGPKYKVHTIKLKPHVLHLDCAMALLRPGLGIICKDRIIGELPESLKDFDFIEVTEEEASKLGANVLVLDEKTVIVDKQLTRIGNELSKKGQEVIEIPYDALANWGGSFRCSHHPLRRDSKLD